jgi:hypothetical protein
VNRQIFCYLLVIKRIYGFTKRQLRAELKKLGHAEDKTAENGLGHFPPSNDAAGLFLLVNHFRLFWSPLRVGHRQDASDPP